MVREVVLNTWHRCMCVHGCLGVLMCLCVRVHGCSACEDVHEYGVCMCNCEYICEWGIRYVCRLSI